MLNYCCFLSKFRVSEKMEKKPKPQNGKKFKNNKFSKNKKFPTKDKPKPKKLDLLKENINKLRSQYDNIDTKTLQAFR